MSRTNCALLVLIAGFASPALMADSGEPVVSEIEIDVPATAVWAAWTVKEEIEAWMSPFSDLELEVGGTWLTSYSEISNPDDDSVIHNEILAFDPGRMLAIRTVKPPADFPYPNAIPDTWTVLYIEPIESQRTRIVARMFGFSGDEESAAMRTFFEWGNQYELENLKRYLEGE